MCLSLKRRFKAVARSAGFSFNNPSNEMQWQQRKFKRLLALAGLKQIAHLIML